MLKLCSNSHTNNTHFTTACNSRNIFSSFQSSFIHTQFKESNCRSKLRVGDELKTCCWYWPSLRLCVLRERIALSTSVTLGFLTNKFPIYFSQLEHRSLCFFNLGNTSDCLSRGIEQHRSVNPSFLVFDSFEEWRATGLASDSALGRQGWVLVFISFSFV